MRKQEHDYLKGYSMYVANKEKDLRRIITDLNKKNEGNTEKDRDIMTLKNTLQRQSEEAKRTEQEKKQLSEKVKYWKSRSEAFE